MAVSITVDRTALLKEAMKALKDSAVLVGIPSASDKNLRTDTPETNAEIGFVNEYGEPSKNIPARPFLMPGINLAMAKNKKIMLNGAKKALSLHDNPVIAIDIALNAVGINSQNAIQNYIVDGDFIPLAPYTLELRKRRGFMGEKPLNVTGSLHDAITYVVES